MSYATVIKRLRESGLVGERPPEPPAPKPPRKIARGYTWRRFDRRKALDAAMAAALNFVKRRKRYRLEELPVPLNLRKDKQQKLVRAGRVRMVKPGTYRAKEQGAK